MPHDAYMRVRKLGVYSSARTLAIFGVALGVITFIFMVGLGASGLSPRLTLGAGLMVGVVLLVLWIVGLFVLGAVGTFLYNVITRIVGPLKVVITKDVLKKVDPLSYAKIAFVFSLIIYSIFALTASSVLLATVGISTTSSSFPLIIIVGAFIFALVVYGFILPYVWALVYNWLAEKMKGVGIVIKDGVLQSINVWSYVKIFLALSVIVFVVERIIGTIAGFALNISQANPLFVTFVGFIAVIVASLVVNALLAWFYNVVAKRFGGCGIDLEKK